MARGATMNPWCDGVADTVGIGRFDFWIRRRGVRATRTPFPIASGSLAQRSKRSAHLGTEELRLLPRREVGALVELVVVDEVRIGLLRPTARSRVDLVREDAHSYRDLDAPGVEEASRRLVRIVPVEARRGDCRVGDPVERDVVEDVALRQPLGLSIEDAGDHLLAARVVVNHPGCEADG